MSSNPAYTLLQPGYIPATSRALAYGDGLFETIRVVDGKAPLWHYHKSRLVEGLARLNITLSERAVEEIWINHSLNTPANCVIKMLVSRGAGGRGYRATPDVLPEILINSFDLPVVPVESYEKGISAVICQHPLSRNPVLAGLKHLNRLDQVLASQELDGSVFEGLMRNLDGNLVEGTKTNIFMLNGDQLLTPSIAQEGVNGVLRRWLFDKAGSIGLQCIERQIREIDLHNSDGLFIGNSVFGLLPVAMLGDSSIPISPAGIKLVDWVRRELEIGVI